MQDPFRPNSNEQLIREAQIGFVIIGLLLCVLVYVAFYRLTGRGQRYSEIAKNVPVARSIGADPYQARTMIQNQFDEQKKPSETLFQAMENFVSQSVQAPKDQLAAATDSLDTVATDEVELATFQRDDVQDESNRLPFKRVPKKNGFEARTTGPPVAMKEAPSFDPYPEPFRPKKQLTPPVIQSDFGTSAGTSAKDLVEDQSRKSNSLDVFEGAEAVAAASKISELPEPTAMSKPKSMAMSKSPANSSFEPQRLTPHSSFDTQSLSSEFVAPKAAPTNPLNNQKIATKPLMIPSKPLGIATPLAKKEVAAHQSEIAPASFEDDSKDGRTEILQQEETERYRVVAGDSLWTVAQDRYGDGIWFRALFEYNQASIGDSGELVPGTILAIPARSELQSRFPRLCPSRVAFEGENKASNTSMRMLDEEMDQRYHLTEKGETLFEIARQRLGQASRYLEVYELNHFRLPDNANHLTPLNRGIRLLLPE